MYKLQIDTINYKSKKNNNENAIDINANLQFINMKNSYALVFDEAITPDSDFEGNTLKKSISETILIIEFLISQKCFYKNIVSNNILNLH